MGKRRSMRKLYPKKRDYNARIIKRKSRINIYKKRADNVKEEIKIRSVVVEEPIKAAAVDILPACIIVQGL
jgi:hypothetical protein